VKSNHLQLEISIEETNQWRKGKRKSKRGAEESDNKNMGWVEEDRRRLEKVRFEEQEVEKMAVQQKEVHNSKSNDKKEVIVKGAKGTRKMSSETKNVNNRRRKE
jgi:hypothetical protein